MSRLTNVSSHAHAIRRKKYEDFKDFCDFWNNYTRIPKEQLKNNPDKYKIPLRCRVNPMTDPKWRSGWLCDGWHHVGPLERRELNRRQIDKIQEEERILRHWEAAATRNTKRKIGDLVDDLDWSN